MFPFEIVQVFLNYLRVEDVCRCARVCKLWHKAVNTDMIWRWRKPFFKLDILNNPENIPNEPLDVIKSRIIQKAIFIWWFCRFVEAPESNEALFVKSIFWFENSFNFQQSLQQLCNSRRLREPSQVAFRIFRNERMIYPDEQSSWKIWFKSTLALSGPQGIADAFENAMTYEVNAQDKSLDRTELMRLITIVVLRHFGFKDLDISNLPAALQIKLNLYNAGQVRLSSYIPPVTISWASRQHEISTGSKKRSAAQVIY